MNHARARARQIERAMVRGPQRRDRVVRPDEPTLAVLTRDDEHHKCRCGFSLCACDRKVNGRSVAQAMGEAEQVPKGWERRADCWCVSGEAALGPRVYRPRMLGAHQVAFTASPRPGVFTHGFTNPYVAMLCALGCEVVRVRGPKTGRLLWRVERDDFCVAWWDEDQLFALVERLTAERTQPKMVRICVNHDGGYAGPCTCEPERIAERAKGEAKAGRVFEWSVTNERFICEVGGLHAYFCIGGAVIIRENGGPDLCPSFEAARDEDAGKRIAERELNRLLDKRERKSGCPTCSGNPCFGFCSVDSYGENVIRGEG